jgi:hypothetical protein
MAPVVRDASLSRKALAVSGQEEGTLVQVAGASLRPA